ncbi:MAG: elongation factor Ts [Deltaproteobacteria bacterium RIFCSPLOWO2_12_FULL_43_16]|nr:MAG: elongation factor Ts [Deltaproteobacteria bacterium GWA2_43_19]OGQ11369.1 MAG: elongation factor Ts [Deltaproteobacteria bacterium RIFCSPHIGHO2_02_FULL_43_33]OGQ37914.1 MAG: elongation factor Ts [Deltaproteobacteria bacterium RIFCSPLOWO2_01_FULL_42_9]OGQ60498.1 MAG: elongation factor Ts [Deltaproteobacteria bacterium RIFCSPLOWO2_12_FULL_43_16]HBR17958.1 elongation factor Ts [Deltaproteobacteria bacterium]
MEISAELVRDLREKTGAGIMDCKKALAATQLNFEAAITYLREKGLASAAKRADKATLEGTVGSYIHAGGKVGVLVEVNCETDFVAKTDEFQSFVKDIAMHIAALSPLYRQREDVPQELIEKERSIFKKQALESGKPEKVVDKMVDGKMEKFFQETCLAEQSFVKKPDVTVKEFLTEIMAKLGENMSIRRFVRFKVGEGIVRN